MQLFDYKARDVAGVIKEGSIEAPTQDLAASELGDRGLTVISITAVKKGGLASFNVDRVKEKDVVIFSRQFAVMISASIPVVQALQVLIDQTVNVKLKSIIAEIADEVNAGSRLSAALARRNTIFSNFYVSVVKAGETSGKLDEVLNYLADEMEKDYDMMHKIRGAMMYPAFVLAGLGGVGAVMMIWVVPKLTAILAETGNGQLPFATRMLMGLSDFLASYWWLIIAVIAAAVFGIRAYGKVPAGRLQIDYIKIKMPIFGNLFQKIAIVRFTRSMNTLIAGGVAIASSLEIAADVVGNTVYRNLILETKKEVESGNTISSVLLRSNHMPSMVGQMFAVGEKTGKLDLVLEKITDFYGREVSNTVANLVTLIEPLIMVIMGLAVGVMVAAIIMPMYSLTSQM